ncbi:MAG: hypothetical protein WCH98_00475 [Verrucomicrobiota bacterium]
MANITAALAGTAFAQSDKNPGHLKMGLVNLKALYSDNPDFDPLVQAESDTNTRWASGAWFIGPDGETLAQMPTSTDPQDSKEFVLTYNVLLGEN